jgi:rare lipoprotein A
MTSSSASLGQSSAVSGALDPSLAGGGEGSYGYGWRQPPQSAAVIDVRRGSRAAAPAESRAAAQPETQTFTQVAAAQTSGQNSGQGAQPWLEQERVGPPYEANGQWYVPTPEPGYEQTGQASWYGAQFHGQPTASGELFDQEGLSAAHPTLPLPSLVQVTNLENGREVIVRLNDRGPFVDGRLIDVSRRAAEVLGFENQGQARVHVRYLGPAPRHVSASAAPSQSAPFQTAPGQPAPAHGPMSLLPDEAPAPAQAEEPARFYVPPQPAQIRSASASAPSGRFMVQVGAFADISNAHNLQATLQPVGPVEIDVRRTSYGELFRVRVGPWASRGEAEAARRQIADLGYDEAILASR